MRKLLSIYLLLSWASALSAQQQPQYTMYMANNFILNPAVAGIEDYTDGQLSYRAQWVGIEDAPGTAYATIPGLIASDLEGRRHGLGAAAGPDESRPPPG